jgi:serine/threonine protein kinase/Tol biopolymer transport system component
MDSRTMAALRGGLSASEFSFLPPLHPHIISSDSTKIYRSSIDLYLENRMPEIGQTISHFRLVEKIGKGGMGEVYLADDTTLDRKVALKFLPEAFTSDPERMARFEREAKLLASLNHPNIAGIYGLEQAEGVRFLVLEYVKGETLQARLSKGALPLEDALALCRQIAEGLEAAHEKGVIHRDLKPANVMIASEEKVKILDFGLAKALSDETQSIDSSQSPTLTEAMTQPGVILGTAAYMSPEQAKGKSVDKRADIWAFGCLLYECLAGKKAFEGETATEILAGVIRGEPDWEMLPETTPQNIRFVLRRCLSKERNQRFRDAADVQIAIEEGLAFHPKPQKATSESKSWRTTLLLGVAAIALIILGGIAAWVMKPPPSVNNVPTCLEITLPSGDQLVADVAPPIAISPDGRHLAYVAFHNGVSQLFLRSLDGFETKQLPGTEGAEHPFFSPDGKWIGFFNSNNLMKVSLAGEAATTICDISGSGGAAWGKDNTIVFARSGDSCLYRVSADGGEVKAITDLDRAQGESSHRWPQFLPGGKALLFTALGGNGWDEFKIAALRLDTGERHITVRKGGHTGRFVPTEQSTGHLIYYRANKLLAIPFDPIHLKVIGNSPETIVEGIAESASPIGAEYSISASGSLAYVPASLRHLVRQLVWIDRKGTIEPIPDAGERSYYNKIWLGLSISPDGTRAAVQVDGGTTEIWVYDIERHTMSQITNEGSSSQFPIWTQDGKRITYTGFRNGLRNIYWKNADGMGEEEQLTTGENQQIPQSWSPEGELCFADWNPTTKQDLWILRLIGDRKQERFLNTQFQETEAQFSPDGHWLAYASNKTGRIEVYVQRYPETGKTWKISREGGEVPRWSHDGSELFYRNGDKMMVVTIQTEPTFWKSEPKTLFERLLEGQFGPGVVAPDGRFLMIQPVEPEPSATKINLILNWFEELKERVPVP